jgi:hypothetical protein
MRIPRAAASHCAPPCKCFEDQPPDLPAARETPPPHVPAGPLCFDAFGSLTGTHLPGPLISCRRLDKTICASVGLYTQLPSTSQSLVAVREKSHNAVRGQNGAPLRRRIMPLAGSRQCESSLLGLHGACSCPARIPEFAACCLHRTAMEYVLTDFAHRYHTV